ncbi:MAG TPA: DUF2059 domain-containing protein [Arachidicoccus sp.]|nr:DUF2059 domain-containing protein [Arachidicoccus sp.]
MKKLILLLVTIIMAVATYSQSDQQQKEGIYLELLKMSGTEKQSVDLTNGMIKQYKLRNPNVPDSVWNKITADSDPKVLLSRFPPIYSKYFTLEEIKALAAFYKTPLGRKVIKVTPALVGDLSKVMAEYGGQLANRIIETLKENGIKDPKQLYDIR